MKIERIEVFPVRCTPEFGYQRPVASFVTEGFVLVKVVTDEGLVGWGEPSPYGGTIAELMLCYENEICSRFTGKNIREAIELTVQEPVREVQGYGKLALNSAVAGMSQALLDILGKAKEKPVYELLQMGKGKTEMRAYASGGMYFTWQDPQCFLEEALAAKEAGFSAWKYRPPIPEAASHLKRNVHPPSFDKEEFVKTAVNLRAAVGDSMDLMVDFGCRIHEMECALEICGVLFELGYRFCEEPLQRDINLYKELKQKVGIPIAGGECFTSTMQYSHWVKQDALDVIQPDANLAGMTEIVNMSTQIKKECVEIVMHNWTNAVNTAANLHIGCALEQCSLIEINTTRNDLRDRIVHNPVSIVDGLIKVPDYPGLGIEVDEELIKYYRFNAQCTM